MVSTSQIVDLAILKISLLFLQVQFFKIVIRYSFPQVVDFFPNNRILLVNCLHFFCNLANLYFNLYLFSLRILPALGMDFILNLHLLVFPFHVYQERFFGIILILLIFSFHIIGHGFNLTFIEKRALICSANSPQKLDFPLKSILLLLSSRHLFEYFHALL